MKRATRKREKKQNKRQDVKSKQSRKKLSSGAKCVNTKGERERERETKTKGTIVKHPIQKKVKRGRETESKQKQYQ